MKQPQSVTSWAVLWRSQSDSHLIRRRGVPVLFAIRRQAREFIEDEYSYIREWDDLRREPHEWNMPIPIRVTIAIAEKKP